MDHIVSRGHSRPLTEIGFYEDVPGKSLLYSSAHDKIPQIRNGESGDWIGSFHGHKGAVWSIKLDYMSGSLAATASGDFSAKLWCVTSGRELHELKHAHVVRTIDFSKDSLHIFTGCQDGLVRIYDTVNINAPPETRRLCERGSSAYATKVVSTPNPSLVLVGTKSGEVQIWDLRQPDASGACCRADISSISGGNAANAFSIMDLELNGSSSEVLVTCGKKVSSLSCTDLAVRAEFAMPEGTTFRDEGGASRHPDGTKFAAGGNDLWVREFDFATGEELRVMKGHHGPVRCVRYHPSGDMLASGSEDGTIRLWSCKNIVADEHEN